MSTRKPSAPAPVPTPRPDLSRVAALAAIQLDTLSRGEPSDLPFVRNLAEALKVEAEEGLGDSLDEGRAARLFDPAVVNLLTRSLRVEGNAPGVPDLPEALKPQLAQLMRDPKDLSKAELEAMRDFALRVSMAARRPIRPRTPLGRGR